MIAPLTIVLLGFFLGMRHALDPDHVIALSTIVSRERSVRRSARVGLLWGVGHSLTIFLVGGAIILFPLVLPPLAASAMELMVAAMLVVLGIRNLYAVFRASDRFHAHGDYVHHHTRNHVHPQDTPLSRLDQFFGSMTGYAFLRPLLIGVVHGLAGSAAVALLIVPAIRGRLLAALYLGIFGAGTVAGMMLMTSALAVPIVYAARRSGRMQRVLATGLSLASIGFGLFMAYEIAGLGSVR